MISNIVMGLAALIFAINGRHWLVNKKPSWLDPDFDRLAQQLRHNQHIACVWVVCGVAILIAIYLKN